MRSRWRELDYAVRTSMIIGVLGGSILLFFEAPFLLQGWALIFVENPVIFIENPFAFLIFVFSLTPFFLFGTTIVLVLAPLTRESRGILGFLLFIGGIVPTYLLLPFLLQTLS